MCTVEEASTEGTGPRQLPQQTDVDASDWDLLLECCFAESISLCSPALTDPLTAPMPPLCSVPTRS